MSSESTSPMRSAARIRGPVWRDGVCESAHGRDPSGVVCSRMASRMVTESAGSTPWPAPRIVSNLAPGISSANASPCRSRNRIRGAVDHQSGDWDRRQRRVFPIVIGGIWSRDSWRTRSRGRAACRGVRGSEPPLHRVSAHLPRERGSLGARPASRGRTGLPRRSTRTAGTPRSAQGGRDRRATRTRC